MEVFQDSGSFRDNYGHIFHHNNEIIRTIEPVAKNEYEQIRDLGIIENSIEAGYLIKTEELNKNDVPEQLSSSSYVLRHERLPFVSYPYEWNFYQLKAAAQHHLNFQLFLLEQGATLRDANAYNVQFIGSRPIFIDLPSIQIYQAGEYWHGYKQFCEQFLNPLLLRALTGVSHNNFYRGSMDGISSADLENLIKGHQKFSINVFSHVVMQSKFAQSTIKNEDDAVSKIHQRKPFKLTAYKAILEQISRWINRLEPKDKKKSTWGTYSENNTYLDTEKEIKSECVRKFCEKNNPELLIDLGCNSGDYSIAALEAGAEYVVGYDFDMNAIEHAFQRNQTTDSKFLPLYFDATNPSPSQGWAQEERPGFDKRNKAEAVIALAFKHHLVIGKNIPMHQALRWIVSISDHGLIEFIPKDDPTIVRMLSVREDIFPEYCEEQFTAILSGLVKIQNSTTISSSGRTIYEF